MIKRIIKYFFPTLYTVEVKIETRIHHTVTREMITKLQSKLSPPILSGSDTGEVASYKLGVQATLRELEKGFMTE